MISGDQCNIVAFANQIGHLRGHRQIEIHLRVLTLESSREGEHEVIGQTRTAMDPQRAAWRRGGETYFTFRGIQRTQDFVHAGEIAQPDLGQRH